MINELCKNRNSINFICFKNRFSKLKIFNFLDIECVLVNNLNYFAHEYSKKNHFDVD